MSRIQMGFTGLYSSPMILEQNIRADVDGDSGVKIHVMILV